MQMKKSNNFWKLLCWLTTELILVGGWMNVCMDGVESCFRDCLALSNNCENRLLVLEEEL
jgi:hypothetical protein